MDKHELSSEQIRPLLTTRWLARPYLYSPTIGSTNHALKEMAAAGSAQHGTVLLADYQQAGRGRLQRRWLAPPASALLMSALLCPNWPNAHMQWLMMVASVAAVTAVSQMTALQPAIKWPNDLMLWHDGCWRKFGGLLLEGELDDNGRLRQAVLGMGINVNLDAAALPQTATPATSLAIACGHSVSRADLLLALLAALEQRYDAAASGQSPLADWQAMLMTVGTAVQVTQADGSQLTGQATAVTEWGELVVATADGNHHTIAAGDVTLRA